MKLEFMEINDPFLTIRQITELWKVDAHTVLKLVHSGELRASDISPGKSTRRRWRIARADFEAFMNARAAVQEA